VLDPTGSNRPNGYTRIVSAFLLAFVILTGVLLFVFSTDTDDRFAWTIKVPITAAFIGACFLSTTPGLVGVFLVRAWSEARLMVVLGQTDGRAARQGRLVRPSARPLR